MRDSFGFVINCFWISVVILSIVHFGLRYLLYLFFSSSRDSSGIKASSAAYLGISVILTVRAHLPPKLSYKELYLFGRSKINSYPDYQSE